MRQRLIIAAGTALLAGGAIAWLSAPAVQAQAGLGQGYLSGAGVQIAAAAANNGNSQAWIVDPRTNTVVFCQVMQGKPACEATTLPGSVNPRR
jgi:hypothetical protein